MAENLNETPEERLKRMNRERVQRFRDKRSPSVRLTRPQNCYKAVEPPAARPDPRSWDWRPPENDIRDANNMPVSEAVPDSRERFEELLRQWIECGTDYAAFANIVGAQGLADFRRLKPLFEHLAAATKLPLSTSRLTELRWRWQEMTPEAFRAKYPEESAEFEASCWCPKPQQHSPEVESLIAESVAACDPQERLRLQKAIMAAMAAEQRQTPRSLEEFKSIAAAQNPVHLSCSCSTCAELTAATFHRETGDDYVVRWVAPASLPVKTVEPELSPFPPEDMLNDELRAGPPFNSMGETADRVRALSASFYWHPLNLRWQRLGT